MHKDAFYGILDGDTNPDMTWFSKDVTKPLMVYKNYLTPQEINQMERGVCQYLEWKLNVDLAMLKEVEGMVQKDFCHPPHLPVSMTSAKVILALSSLGYLKLLNHTQVPATNPVGDCPWFKLDKEPISAPPLLVQHFQELLTAFGFNWHTAPGEVEAELAYFHSHGLIDAMCHLKSSSEYRDIKVYTSDALQHGPFLKWEDLLLIVLMNGAGYDFGLPNCNMDISHHLAWYGLRRSLVQAAADQKFVDFMSFITKWHKDLCWVLERDPEHHLGWRYYELVHVIEEECTKFPNPAILAAYLSPLMSCLRPRLMDACAGAIIHALLQIPSNVNSQVLQDHLQVMNYCNRLVPFYKISLPNQPLLAAPIGVDIDMSSCDMEVPTTVLEFSRPDLVQSPTSSPASQSKLEGGDRDNMMVDLTANTAENINYQAGCPTGSPDKYKKKGRALPAAKEQPTLHAAHQIKEAGKQTHLQAARTRATYGRHIHQGCAMKKKYMDQILTWSESLCLLNVPFQYIQLVMAGLESLPPEALNKVTNAAAFTLWTRNFELVKLKHGDVQFDNIAIDGMFLKYLQGEEQSLTINEHGTYFEVHLKNQKGNCYKIYPCPNMGTACDAF
ncbi:hypothetical protein J3A83DRAFT_4399710 [Scleroderma citrinum]